jgi:hypothetical protein
MLLLAKLLLLLHVPAGGLVDIEFGWNGCLVIGHDTGGLGKMPG